MTLSEKLLPFLSNYLDAFDHSSSAGHNLEFPDFQLYAHDYLSFAEKELTESSQDSLINCVSHLKRAAECQMDTFIYICGLTGSLKKKNLGFDAKLNFLEDIGIFSSRTLSRFNTIRNKIEHEYTIPQVSDIDLYFDLVSALIAILQGSMYLLSYGSELVFDILDDDGNLVGNFKIEYNYSELRINVDWNINEEAECISVGFAENRVDFLYFLKVLILLNQLYCLSIDYMLQQMEIKSCS